MVVERENFDTEERDSDFYPQKMIEESRKEKRKERGEK